MERRPVDEVTDVRNMFWPDDVWGCWGECVAVCDELVAEAEACQTLFAPEMLWVERGLANT